MKGWEKLAQVYDTQPTQPVYLCLKNKTYYSPYLPTLMQTPTSNTKPIDYYRKDRKN